MSVGLLPPPFPVLWPAEYREVALRLGAGNPLLLMGEPHPSEALPDPEALHDPVGEGRFQPVPFAVRKHRDRAVVLATSRCFSYCRFCFRRGTPPGSEREPASSDWERIFSWVASEPSLEEVILSGGDPLTLPDRALAAIAARLARIPHLRRWRIHTRAPVVFPDRVTSDLLRSLTVGLPLRVFVHAGHPAELRSSSATALLRFADAEISVLNQSVLLAGVNDTPEVLEELYLGLSVLGVKPRYLHHPDRAPGDARFRLSIRRGLAVYAALKRRLGTASPDYVLDLPSGAGKCPVEDLNAVGEEAEPGRRRTRYRWDRPAHWDSLFPGSRSHWWDIWEQTEETNREVPKGARARIVPIGTRPPMS